MATESRIAILSEVIRSCQFFQHLHAKDDDDEEDDEGDDGFVNDDDDDDDEICDRLSEDEEQKAHLDPPFLPCHCLPVSENLVEASALEFFHE